MIHRRLRKGDEMRWKPENESPTFKRNVSGLGPLFFGPNSSRSRSLVNENHSKIRVKGRLKMCVHTYSFFNRKIYLFKARAKLPNGARSVHFLWKFLFELSSNKMRRMSERGRWPVCDATIASHLAALSTGNGIISLHSHLLPLPWRTLKAQRFTHTLGVSYVLRTLFWSAECAVPSRFCGAAYCLRCQTLTSPRRLRRVVHPECFPPAPKCCTFITTGKGRGVRYHTVIWSHVKALTRTGFITFIRAISVLALR